MWDLGKSCRAAWKAAVVRDQASIVAAVTGLVPPAELSSPVPGSEEVDSDLSVAGCFPGRGPRVENLNKVLLGVLSSSLHL